MVAITGERLCGIGSKIVSATLAGRDAEVTLDNCALVRAVVADLGAFLVGDVVLTADTGDTVTKVNGFTYLAEGNVTSVTPAAGQGQTLVTIRGDSLFGGGNAPDEVTMAGVTAQVVGEFNSSYLVVRVGAGPLGVGQEIGDVVIVSDTGVTVRGLDAWTYSTVTGVSPSSGQGGTLVTISGVGLFAGGGDVASVTLANTAVQRIVSRSSTQIVVEARALVVAGDQSGPVVLTADNGQQVQSRAGVANNIVFDFTYKVPGVIELVRPSQGQVGTVVTVRGTQLLGYGSDLASATLDGVAVDDIVTANATYVELVAGFSPAASGAPGAVALVADTGALVRLAAAWSYVAPGNVTEVSPPEGQAGTRVTLTGTDLLAGANDLARVTLAGEAVREIVRASNTEVVVVAAASAAAKVGAVVLVSSEGGLVELANGWRYLAPGLLASVEPNVGQFGTQVVLRGERLLGGGASVVSVTLNGAEVASIDAFNSTRVVVTAGPGSGNGAVVITADTGAEVVLADAWTYLTAGNITAVTPGSGQLGTRVTIEGTNLRGGGSEVVSVTLANRTAAIVQEGNEAVVVVVDSAPAGRGDVVLVSDTAATVVLADGWLQLTDGVIAAVAPGSGQTGTRVTISGQRLLGGAPDVASVTLAGVAAAYAAGSGSDSTVVVTAQAGGQVGLVGDVVVTATTGATITAAQAFFYVPAGNISAVAPPTGGNRTGGGVTGVKQRGGGGAIADALFGGVSVREVVSSSNTSVVVVVDANDAGVVNVVLVADTGATTVLEASFTYLNPPLFASVFPDSGQEGTLVTINGARMLGGGATI